MKYLSRRMARSNGWAWTTHTAVPPVICFNIFCHNRQNLKIIHTRLQRYYDEKFNRSFYRTLTWTTLLHDSRAVNNSSEQLAIRQKYLVHNAAHNRDSWIGGIFVADGMSNRWYVRTEEGTTSRRSSGSYSKTHGTRV